MWPAHAKLVVPFALSLGLALGPARALTSQEPTSPTPRTDRIRLGVVLGGTGFLGLVTEYKRADWSGELTISTISFHEISVAITGKRYFSGGSLRPMVGLGFWSLSAWSEEGSGSVFILRAPVGLDWRIRGEHSVGIEVGLNRALAVDRLDPEDDTPPSSRLIPFPGAYYRYGWDP